MISKSNAAQSAGIFTSKVSFFLSEDCRFFVQIPQDFFKELQNLILTVALPSFSWSITRRTFPRGQPQRDRTYKPRPLPQSVTTPLLNFTLPEANQPSGLPLPSRSQARSGRTFSLRSIFVEANNSEASDCVQTFIFFSASQRSNFSCSSRYSGKMYCYGVCQRRECFP